MKTKAPVVSQAQRMEKKLKKERRNRIFLRVCAVLLAVIIAFVGVTTLVTVGGLRANMKKANSFPAVEGAQPLPENYADGCWNIYSDDGLKIVQLTDVHLGGGWMSIGKDGMALNAVAAMLAAEKPDFVIVTGDLAYPVPFQAGTFNNKSGAKLFATLMEKLGIYWTLTFGNHDTEAYSYYSREDIAQFYAGEEYPHCLLQPGPDEVDGCGNQVFNIVNSDGIITRALLLFDSHSYVDGDILGIQWKYDNIHANQVEWYQETVEALASKNRDVLAGMDTAQAAAYARYGETVPSSVYLHIPLTEYKDAWDEYVQNGMRDTENVKHKYGVAGETGRVVYSGIYSDELFETMQALGSTDTVFCGHDHLNNFSLNYKGIQLTYGMSVDYLAYIGISKKGSQRGCTVIAIAPDGGIDFSQENYYQDKYVSFYEKEEVTMDNT